MRLILVAAVMLLSACESSVLRPKADSKRSDAAEIHAQLASRYLQQGRLDLARDRVSRALELDPSRPSSQTVAAALAETIGDFANAEKHYRLAVKAKDAGGAERNNLGQFLCKQRRFSEARSEFDAALADPYYKNGETAALNAGVCARLAGDSASAERFLKSALARAPDDPLVLLPMAELMFETGAYMRGRAFLQRFEAAGGSAPSALALGFKIESALGSQMAANEYKQRLGREFPDSAEARALKE
jgi:type IV pilus assembly protein PilF